MFHIDSIHVDGFWGRYVIDAQFHNNVTFLIGENGTGKTTLINLIAAALAGDFLTLDKLPFRSIEIRFRSGSSRKKPRIRVSKIQDSTTGIDCIEYEIKPSSSSEVTRFTLDDIEEQRILRVRHNIPASFTRSSKHKRDITHAINEIVSIVWLSIHRSTLLNNVDERRIPERAYDSTVDMKILELSNRITRYYSVLNSKRDSSVRDFQEFTFLSLLEDREESRLFELAKITDIEEQKSYLVEAFQQLGVAKEKFSKKANSYFSRLNSARDLEPGSGVTLQQLQALVVLQQIQQITQKWSQEKFKQDEIFKDFDHFIEIMNSLFVRKNLSVSNASELVAKNEAGDEISISFLSSGEKQLLILLGEALLQNHKTCVYIADEPELSLHVKWQEKVIPSILSLNENAQMVVATHSPDIIGPFSKNVIRMENLLVHE